MQCRYCRTWNEEDERRCVRCGRRLYGSAARPSAGSYPVANGAATAPAFAALPGKQPIVSAAPEKISYQPSLFRDAANGPKVIPIPTLSPIRPQEREPAIPVRKTQRAPLPSLPSRATSRRRSDSQQTLDFHASNASPGLQVEAVIYCDAPVAPPTHRLLAAVFDLSMIAVAISIFLSIFLVSGGMLVVSKANAPYFLGAAVLIALLYRALFCLGNGDTPGMRFAGLRLVDFDGKRPNREQRSVRQIASVLSVLSAGLGLVWALVDEENLTWHDHISKTFPTIG